MVVYRIELDAFDSEGNETRSCYTHGFPSHEEADWWCSLNPYILGMKFLFEVERNEREHLVEVN